MAANDLPEDLWAKILLCVKPGEIPTLNRGVAAALRRDSLWKAFAASRAPLLWGALAATPPGRDRFRRAVLLESDTGPVGPVTPALDEWALDEWAQDDLMCIVIVTQGDAEIFRARFPFEPDVADQKFFEFGAQVNCSVALQHGVSPPPYLATNRILAPECSIPFDAVMGPCLNSSPMPEPDSLTTRYLLEQSDGRVAKLVTFDRSHVNNTNGRYNNMEGSGNFELYFWSDQRVGRWKFEFVLALTFPGYDEDTFEPDAPFEDGRVFSMELQASNLPDEYDPDEYDLEESELVIEDLQQSIAGLAWR